MNMKKILSILAFSCVLALGACDRILDLEPVDDSTATTFWKNEGNVKTYLTRLYIDLRSDYNLPFVLGEVRGGTLKNGNAIDGVSLNYPNIATNTLTKDVTGVTNWAGIYSSLLDVNNYIMNLEDGCRFLSDDARRAYLAPAYGIRAWYYFMLYRTYGGVPLEKSPRILESGMSLTDYYMARSTAKETLAFIEEDIAKSEEYYGTNRNFDCYTWSYYATQMLKAQVYLWAAKVDTKFVDKAGNTDGSYTVENKAENLATAKKALQVLVDSRKFSLQPTYASVFSYDNKANGEIIFAIYFDKNESTNAGANFVSKQDYLDGLYDVDGNHFSNPLDLCSTGTLRNEYRPSFVQSLATTDSRRGFFLDVYTTADPATREYGTNMTKYLGHAEGSTRYYDNDVIFYRYADVLLMLAEIENAEGNPAGAAPYINQIRTRACGSDAETFTALTQAETELALLKERDKEFFAEGTRWFDLIRMQDASGKPLAFSAAAAYPETLGGTAVPVLGSDEEYKLLWPVNVAVLTGDNLLAQTYGY